MNGQGTSRGGKRAYNPWFMKKNGNTLQNQRQKPLFTLKSNGQFNDDGDDDNDQQPNSEASRRFENLVPRTDDLVISIEREPGAYLGWKLYFPLKSFNESSDLVRKVQAYESHIDRSIQLYDIDDISKNFRFSLKRESLEKDKPFFDDWPSFKNDLKYKTTESLACAGLAMHNLISKRMPQNEDLTTRKIFVRPVGYPQKIVKIKDAKEITNELVRVQGTVVAQEKIQFSSKMICYKCSLCSTMLVVKQSADLGPMTSPSKCQRGCPARGKFREVLSSPYTILQTKQILRVQDCNLKTNDKVFMLDVELVGDFCDSVNIGSIAKFTGINKFIKNDKKSYAGGPIGNVKSYLKCFNVEFEAKKDSISITGTLEQNISSVDLDFINHLKREPSIFRVLVNSLAPDIFGREEVKAGLILCLFSGNKCMANRRSESHVLLVGNPGNGKSQMLMACAEASYTGNYVNGPTSSGVALTAAVGKRDCVEAGALILSKDGICCIDELDKMAGHHANTLLECMEQQTVSISKHGARAELAAPVSIIAAANPISSFYDRDKSVMQNVKISSPLLSRFDLIFVLTDQPKSKDDELLAHFNQHRNQSRSSSYNQKPSQSNFDRRNLKWLKRSDGEDISLIPLKNLQMLIKFSKDTINPSIEEAAQVEISKFFMRMREEAAAANQSEQVTFRQLEALMRLVKARARADLQTNATVEHVTDVLNIVKFSMGGNLNDDHHNDRIDDGPILPKRPKIAAKLSIPKQVKAFNDFLQDESDRLNRNTFTKSEMKSMASEIGIGRDYEVVIDKLNQCSRVLLQPGGYKVVLS